MAGFTVWPAIIGFSILCFGMSQGNLFSPFPSFTTDQLDLNFFLWLY